MAEIARAATADNFREIVVQASHSVPVLVDFWADWCQPCHILMPVLAKLAEDYSGKLVLAKVDTEAERELAARYGVRSLPTLKLFKDGEVIDEIIGALPESQIRAFLDRHIPRESDTLVARARDLAEAGDLDAALALARQARESDPGNPRVLLALASVQTASGDPRSALDSLARLPEDEQTKPEVMQLRVRLGLEVALGQAPTEETLSQRLEADPSDSEACHQLALRKLLAGEHEAALEFLLSLMARDRAYGDDAARKTLLQAFSLLGGESELVRRYRVRLFDLLH